MSKRLKKIVAVVFCAALVVGTAGCGKKKEDADQGKKIKDVAVADIAAKVQEAYGENYLAGYQYTEEEVQTKFGINPEDCEEYVAQGAMISVHVDTFVAVKAKAGKKEAVKTALEAYQTTLKEDTLQYPMNLPKIQASVIKEYGDYVFFIMLGMLDEEKLETADEEELLKAFGEQNEIAVKAIEDLLYGVQ